LAARCATGAPRPPPAETLGMGETTTGKARATSARTAAVLVLCLFRGESALPWLATNG